MVSIFILSIGFFTGVKIANYNNSFKNDEIIKAMHSVNAGNNIRWGFFPDSSTVEIRFSNNVTPSCIVKDNVIKISPIMNSSFCEIRLFKR